MPWAIFSKSRLHSCILGSSTVLKSSLYVGDRFWCVFCIFPEMNPYLLFAELMQGLRNTVCFLYLSENIWREEYTLLTGAVLSRVGCTSTLPASHLPHTEVSWKIWDSGVHAELRKSQSSCLNLRMQPQRNMTVFGADKIWVCTSECLLTSIPTVSEQVLAEENANTLHSMTMLQIRNSCSYLTLVPSEAEQILRFQLNAYESLPWGKKMIPPVKFHLNSQKMGKMCWMRQLVMVLYRDYYYVTPWVMIYLLHVPF